MATTYEILGRFMGVSGITAGFRSVSQAATQSAQAVTNSSRAGAQAMSAHATTLNRASHAFNRFYGVHFTAHTVMRAQLDSLRDYAREAQKLAQAQFQFKAVGLSDAENSRAFRAVAQTVRDLKGLRIDEVTETITDLHTAFGDLDHAMEHLGTASKFRFGMSTMLGDKFSPEQIERQIQNGFKFLEITGVVMKGSEVVHERFNAMAQIMAATGGRVQASDMLLMARRAGPALHGLSTEGMRNIASLIPESGANQVGTGLMSLYQTLIGGVMKQSAAMEFQRLGLLGRTPAEQRQRMEFNKSGIVKKVKPGAFGDLGDALMEDPLKAADMIMEAMKKPLTGPAIDTENMNEVRKEIAVLFGNRTAQRLVNILTTQRPQVIKEAKLAAGAKTIEELYSAALESPMGKIKQFENEIANLKMTIGGPLLSAVSSAAQTFAPFIRLMGEHPKVTMFALALFKLTSITAQLGMAMRLSGMTGFYATAAAGAAAPQTQGAAAFNALFKQQVATAGTLKWYQSNLVQGVSAIAALAAVMYGVTLILNEYEKEQAAWAEEEKVMRENARSRLRLYGKAPTEVIEKTFRGGAGSDVGAFLNTPAGDWTWAGMAGAMYGRGFMGFGRETPKELLNQYSTTNRSPEERTALVAQIADIMSKQMPWLKAPSQMGFFMEAVQKSESMSALQKEAMQRAALKAQPKAYGEWTAAMGTVGVAGPMAMAQQLEAATKLLVEQDQAAAQAIQQSSTQAAESLRRVAEAADEAAGRFGRALIKEPGEGGEVGVVPGMARGGVVRGPRVVVAGEAGPEVFMPVSKFLQTLGPGSGGMTIQITNHIGGDVSAETIARIEQAQRRAIRESMSEIRGGLDERAREREQMI
jgi:hypothetical protein